ncbi:hypothetical protein RJT34_11311 [Clitoria ternatea]|uniref:Uncharacterized protein n=1 Tax=Clitoria ternatea TaxID=43366 RepID=A0AAN9PKF1_CLITE
MTSYGFAFQILGSVYPKPWFCSFNHEFLEQILDVEFEAHICVINWVDVCVKPRCFSLFEVLCTISPHYEMHLIDRLEMIAEYCTFLVHCCFSIE